MLYFSVTGLNTIAAFAGGAFGRKRPNRNSVCRGMLQRNIE
jgi:hypothetical protein